MKKIISIAILFTIAVTIHAQDIAKAIKIKNKDVYVLVNISGKYTDLGSVHLNQDQIGMTENLESRIEMFIDNAPLIDYDAIYTRDGQTARLIKYDKEEIDGVSLISVKRPVFFFSIPVKEYSVVAIKTIEKTEIHLAFYKIIESFVSKAKDLNYDAMIIKKDKVEYITYK